MEILNGITGTINFLRRPAILFTISVAGFFLVLFKLREIFAKKETIIALELGLAGFIGVSMLHPTFRDVVTKRDNIPIVGMLFLLAFFIWLSINKMVTNDNLIDAGKEVENKQEAKELTYTWPDLVFSEFICTIVLWCVLLIWSI